MLHAGCEFYNLSSACFDVPWYLYYWWVISHIFSVEHPTHAFVRFQVEYHKRMDVLSNMGFLAMFQYVSALHPLGSSLTKGSSVTSSKTKGSAIHFHKLAQRKQHPPFDPQTFHYFCRRDDFALVVFAGSQSHARHGYLCSLAISCLPHLAFGHCGGYCIWGVWDRRIEAGSGLVDAWLWKGLRFTYVCILHLVAINLCGSWHLGSLFQLLNTWGNTQYHSVSSANRLARRIAYLCLCN